MHPRDTPAGVSAVMVAHRILLSALGSIDGNDRPVHSLMLSMYAKVKGLRTFGATLNGKGLGPCTPPTLPFSIFPAQ